METFTENQLKDIRKIFDQFDRNKNSSIEKSELGALCIALNNPMSNAELHDIFAKLDKDNSGNIEWDEFIRYWTEE